MNGKGCRRDTVFVAGLRKSVKFADAHLRAAAACLVEPIVSQEIAKDLLRHDIRVVDTDTKSILIGSTVAYKHTMDNVCASVAFWLGNRILP